MADNATEIAAIEALLESGAKSVTVDGVTTQFDLDGLRKELRRLRAEDDVRQTRRPFSASVDLSGF